MVLIFTAELVNKYLLQKLLKIKKKEDNALLWRHSVKIKTIKIDKKSSEAYVPDVILKFDVIRLKNLVS